MKTAISIPERDFERFERVASRHGMNRSQFYREAARRLADELENEGELTRLANTVLARAVANDVPEDTEEFLRASERIIETGSDW